MKFYIISFLFITVISCGNKSEPYSNTPTVAKDTTVCYMKDIKPIFDNRCVRCHANYANFSNAQNDMYDIESQTSRRIMPKEGSLTEDEIQKIKDWVANEGKDCQ